MFSRFFLSLIFTLLLHAAPAWAVNCPTCNTASEGKICYASDDKALMVCNGSTWVDQSASCALTVPSHSCGACNTGNNGKICYETTAGMTFFCNGELWRGTRQMTPARSTSANACGYTERGVIGTWNGHNVDTRQFTINGQPGWVLTVAITGSSVDKHFPRGDNFLGGVTLNGSFNSSCLSGGETAWWGLTKPSGMTTPTHYEAGTEADGAQFFKHKEYCSDVGIVQCWGAAANGGTTPSPVIVGKSNSIVGGRAMMCAIKADNAVQCWGNSTYGGTTPSPTIYAKSLVAGQNSVCAIKLDDTVQCWGVSSWGGSTPSPVISAKSLAAARNAVCAIKLDDTVQCWGDTNYGGATPSPAISAKSISSNVIGDAMCAIKMDNTVQCWGRADTGGTTPSPVIAAKSITAGPFAMCAIKTDDTVQCWGTYGSGGYGGTSPSPVIQAKSIVGGQAMCAIKLDDTVQCWGMAANGGTTPSPVIAAKSIAAGYASICAIKLDDKVQCWGLAANGGTTPSPVISAKSIVAGYYNMCAIKTDDKVQCWGTAANGGTTPSPTIRAYSVFAQGTGYNAATCAIKRILNYTGTWSSSAWTACSGGTQTRTNTCSTGNPEDCDPATQPTTSQACSSYNCTGAAPPIPTAVSVTSSFMAPSCRLTFYTGSFTNADGHYVDRQVNGGAWTYFWQEVKLTNGSYTVGTSECNAAPSGSTVCYRFRSFNCPSSRAVSGASNSVCLTMP